MQVRLYYVSRDKNDRAVNFLGLTVYEKDIYSGSVEETNKHLESKEEKLVVTR